MKNKKGNVRHPVLFIATMNARSPAVKGGASSTTAINSLFDHKALHSPATLSIGDAHGIDTRSEPGDIELVDLNTR